MEAEVDGVWSRLLAQPFAVLMAVIGVGFALTAIVLPLHQLTEATASATVQVAAQDATDNLARLPGIPGAAVLEPTDSDGLTVTLTATAGADGQPVPATLRLLSEAGTALWAASLAVIFGLLTGIIMRIGSADPFAAENARRLVGIAAAIVVGSVGADTLNWLNATVIYDFVAAKPPIVVTPYYSLLPLLLAALVLVLASAFRRGQRIQADVEGLV
ncbi:MAG: DUF2975 domain-containing protein [Candidatus Nanopelagicales bacterium]